MSEGAASAVAQPTVALSVQLERADARARAAKAPEEGFLELSPKGLQAYAQALAFAWRVLGVRAGDRVVIYDYGSSPVAYLASAVFAPYLEKGAAELTRSMALCVDGLPDNATRLAHVLSHFQPHFVFARAELVPLLVGGPTAVALEQRAAMLVVSADEDRPAYSERRLWEERWQGGVSLLARCDRAAFLAAECPDCAALRIPGDLYEVHPDPRIAAPAWGGVQDLCVRPRFVEVGHMATGLSVRLPAGEGALVPPRPRAHTGGLLAPRETVEDVGGHAHRGLRLA